MCQHWDQNSTLVNGQYTAQSDLYDFGVMIQGWAGCVQTDCGKAFLQLLKPAAGRQLMSAQELLTAAQPWFSEQGM